MAKTKQLDYKPAQAIIGLAVREAKRLKNDYLDTQHILLALTSDPESTVAKALSDIGLTPSKLRAAIEFIIGHGDKEPEKVKLSPRAKRVGDIALEEARRLNCDYCGGEHLLLGILSEQDNMAFGILDGLAGEKLLDQVRSSIMGKVKGGFRGI